MENLQLGTGALPELADPRNWTPASVGASPLFDKSCFIDVFLKMRVSMQGHIGSCVGNTYEEMVRGIIFQLTGIEPDELSWRWIYAICKALDGAPGEGTFPSLAAKVIRKYGVPLAKYCPNEINLDHESFVYNRTLKDKASLIAAFGQEAYDDAQSRRAGADVTFPVSLDGLRQAVTYAKQNKGGVAICRQIGNTYWTDINGVSSWRKDKIMPIRVPAIIVSGHEESLYGYDEEAGTNRLVIYWLNHWSPMWGATTDGGADGGRGFEYADVWLKDITEIRVTVPVVPVAPDTFKYTFSKNLVRGMEGPDVVALQHALKIDGEFPANIPFDVHFGPLTEQAVKDFQKKYNISPIGQVGPITRGKLNQLFS